MEAEDPPHQQPTAAATATPTRWECELIYFVQNKCKVLAFDNIVSICTDFYTNAEVVEARNVISDAVGTNKRLAKHKGCRDAEKRRRTVADIAKICLDPNVQLPVFCSVNMNRIPAVGIEHVDISALVQEVAALRAEVRSFTRVKGEIANIRDTLHNIHNEASTSGTVIVDSDFPALGQCSTDTSASSATNFKEKSFAGVANSLRSSGLTLKPEATRKPAKKPVVGASSSNSHVKSVNTTVRNVDLFVSRLHPNTHTNELVDCVNSMKGDLQVHDVECVKLKSKFESLYSSYHVSIKVDSTHLHDAVETFMSADAWPTGIFVKRYFRAKNGTQ